MQVCATLLYVVYLMLAVYGCLNIKEGLDPKFLVRESFYLSNFYKLIDETFWVEGNLALASPRLEAKLC